MRKESGSRTNSPGVIYRIRYKSKEEREELARKISREHAIEVINVKNPLEAMVKDALLQNGAQALYEPFLFRVDKKINGHGDLAFAPDFILPYNYKDDRYVVIEPHCFGRSNADEIKTYAGKVKMAKERYNLYVVLISLPVTNRKELVLNEVGSSIDEFWYGKHFADGGPQQLASQIRNFLGTTNVKPVSAIGNMLEMLSVAKGPSGLVYSNEQKKLAQDTKQIGQMAQA